MNIVKNITYPYADNDIYILEKLGNNLFINNNERGIIMLGGDLSPVKQILTDSLPYIYSIFKNDINDQLMFYSSQEEEKLVYVDVVTEKSTSLDVSTIIGAICPIYYWQKDEIILSTYNHHFYKITIFNQTVDELSARHVGKNYADWYAYRQEFLLHDHNVYDVDPHRESFIYAHDDEVVFYDYKKQYRKGIKALAKVYHDLIYQENYFCFISEKCLYISIENETITLYPESEAYVFLRARFVKRNGSMILVALMSDKANSQRNILVSYVFTGI